MSLWIYRTIAGLRPVFNLYWRFELVDATGAIPREGPAIVAANHACFLDPWFLGPLMFPRPVHYLITRKWYSKSSFWSTFFEAQGTIPTEDGDPAGTVEKICKALEAGKIVGIFPEGRISYDGRVRRFRSGVARIAAVSGAPVLPVGIRGAFESLPRTRRLPKPGTITAHVGPPLVFPGAPCSEPAPRDIVEFRDRVLREVCKLAGQEDRFASLESAPSLSGTAGAEPDAGRVAP